MILEIWEVYEEDSNVYIIFGNKEDAENQTIITRVNTIAKTSVHLSRKEIQILISGGYVYAD